MKLQSDFQKKVMVADWAGEEPPAVFQAILEELKKWHSPFKLLLVLTQPLPPDEMSALIKHVKRLKAFHMKKLYCCIPGSDEAEVAALADQFGVDFFSHFAQAAAFLRLDKQSARTGKGDLRSAIKIDNDFQNQLIEITWDEPVSIETPADLDIFLDKLQANLRLWHSPWNCLLHIDELSLAAETETLFYRKLKLLKSMHLRKLCFLGTRSFQDPGLQKVPVLRSRHKALISLNKKSDPGALAGDKAGCLSPK